MKSKILGKQRWDTTGTLTGLIENNQISGAIKIPKKLIPYTGFDKI